MELNEMIRNARKQAELTQQQLSDKYKIPVRTLVDWERGVRTPPEYVVDLLLRCMVIDFPTGTALSEQEPETVTEPTYTFTDQYGKSLTPKLEALVRVEYEAGKVQPQPEPQEQDFYGDLVGTGKKRKGKLYQCTHIDLDSKLSFGFMFRVIKEV